MCRLFVTSGRRAAHRVYCAGCRTTRFGSFRCQSVLCIILLAGYKKKSMYYFNKTSGLLYALCLKTFAINESLTIQYRGFNYLCRIQLTYANE